MNYPLPLMSHRSQEPRTFPRPAAGGLFLAWILVSSTAFPQAAPAPVATPKPPSVPADPLGRNTPRGTVVGFLGAAQRGDTDRADEFLITPKKGDELAELVSQLAYVLNNSRVSNISDSPEGTDQPGISRGTERIATVATGDEPLHIDLSHVEHDQEWIWLFSAQTLQGIPDAYELQVEASFSRYLPAFLTKPVWLSIPRWKYLALLGAFLLAGTLVFIVRRTLDRVLIRWLDARSIPNSDRLAGRLTRPLRILIWLFLAELIVAFAALPLLARQWWYSAVSKLAVIAITWLVLAIINVAALVYLGIVERTGAADITAVVRLAQRTINLLCLFFAVVIVLKIAGYDVSAILAGLGVGGIALAFAAQKTLENLFGGVSLILDRPIRVGDDCRIGDKVGKVVDIGLRSTSLLTPDRSVLTIPNGQLSTMTLENLSMRDMIWFRHVLGVRRETSVEQLEKVLAALRKMLAEDPMVEQSTYRVRLVKTDAQSFDIEMFCHIRTRNFADFLAAQESLLLSSLRTLEAEGTALAPTSRTVYLNKDTSPETAIPGALSRAVKAD